MRYPTGRLALDGASLSVAPGELAVILGANGSGKSTMLRIIAGIMRPTDGQVRVLGRSITGLTGRALDEARRTLGMVFQHANLVKRRSVIANVVTGTLGRHRTVATSVGLLPNSEFPLALHCIEQVGLTRAGLAAGGDAVRRPGAARLDRPRPGAATARDAGRRAGGEPRSGSERGGDAPAAPAGHRTGAGRAVRAAPARAGPALCGPPAGPAAGRDRLRRPSGPGQPERNRQSVRRISTRHDIQHECHGAARRVRTTGRSVPHDLAHCGCPSVRCCACAGWYRCAGGTGGADHRRQGHRRHRLPRHAARLLAVVAATVAGVGDRRYRHLRHRGRLALRTATGDSLPPATPRRPPCRTMRAGR